LNALIDTSLSKCAQTVLSVTNSEKRKSSPTGDPNMSRFGEAESGLRPARLSLINYVVDILTFWHRSFTFKF